MMAEEIEAAVVRVFRSTEAVELELEGGRRRVFLIEQTHEWQELEGARVLVRLEGLEIRSWRPAPDAAPGGAQNVQAAS